MFTYVLAKQLSTSIGISTALMIGKENEDIEKIWTMSSKYKVWFYLVIEKNKQ